jgi:hypothetical protein
MHTLFDFLTHTKAMGYIVAGLLLLCFIPFWRFLTERENARHAPTGHHHPDRRS